MAADQREARPSHWPWPPFPPSQDLLFGREEICQGRPVLPAKRTLDRFPPFRTIKTEGKGAGGLRGARPPWRSMRQRLMRALQRARPPAPDCPYPALSPISYFRIGFLPIVFRATIRIATLPSALACGCRHGAPWCSGYQGCCYLCSDLWSPSHLVPDYQPRPRSHPNSALSHISQIPISR